MKIQLIDTDYVMINNKPVVRLFGKNDSGKPVCCFYEGFYPYFYLNTNETLENVKKELIKFGNEIRSVEETEKFLPIGYSEKKTTVFKITNTNPSKVPEIRDSLLSLGNVYEADILFKYRFLVDMGIKGMEWIDIKASKTFTKTVTCQSLKVEKIKKMDVVENIDLKYLSFDIECISKDGMRLPDSKKDPIIMISVAFDRKFHGKKDIVLCTNKRAKNALRFDTEEEMLRRFVEIIKEYDPDIITGYNINNFDLPYIIDRLKENKLSAAIGRCEDKQAYSRKFGYSNIVTVPGRVVVDPYQIIKNDPWVKYKSYSLNNIARDILGEEKVDVKISEIPKLWSGNEKEVAKLVEYSRKDSVLALRLVIDKGLLDKFFELSKISGLLLQDAIGGQSIRVETCFLHKFHEKGFLMPAKPDGKEISRRMSEREEYGLKGGFVLEPKTGLHSDGCVLVLDFKSLYPSLMITYNICPTALLLEDRKDLKTTESPSGVKFVDASVRRGVLPEIVKELLDARKKAKKQMVSEKNKERIRILNAKQLALKTMANAFYGYTGYFRARLYVIDVASAITSFGRNLIKKVKRACEDNFDVEVIYGDTDSIFVKTKTTDLEEAQKMGDKIVAFVNKKMPGVLELEFEKTFKTFLILTKKRYAAWKFVKVNGKWVDEIEMKGIETVRRDWCGLVSNTMNSVLETILKEGDVKKAIKEVKEILEKLKNNEIPLEQLCVIKGITKNPKDYDGILPHIELARKMAKRDATSAPMVGERIPFVIIKGNQMLSKRAETPEYAKEKNLEIDSNYYIHSQLLPPLERIFSSVGVNKTELLGLGRQMNFFEIMKSPKKTLKTEKGPKILDGWEEFVCNKCRKSVRRPPLTGRCECGGNFLIAYQGSVSNVCRVK